jgi:hypothetical protein
VQQGSEDLPGSLKSQDSVRERIESRRVPKQMDPFKEYYLEWKTNLQLISAHKVLLVSSYPVET